MNNPIPLGAPTVQRMSIGEVALWSLAALVLAALFLLWPVILVLFGLSIITKEEDLTSRLMGLGAFVAGVCGLFMANAVYGHSPTMHVEVLLAIALPYLAMAAATFCFVNLVCKALATSNGTA